MRKTKGNDGKLARAKEPGNLGDDLTIGFSMVQLRLMLAWQNGSVTPSAPQLIG